MKRVRCPKCDNYITFDEKKYKKDRHWCLNAHNRGKQFGIRIGTSNSETRRKKTSRKNADGSKYGYIVVIENVFHYKQVIPLQMGINVIGRYMKGSGVNCPIETNDPSIDINHCTITVSKDKQGKLKYILKRRTELHRHFRGQCHSGRPRTARDRGRNPLHNRCDKHHPPHPTRINPRHNLRKRLAMRTIIASLFRISFMKATLSILPQSRQQLVVFIFRPHRYAKTVVAQKQHRCNCRQRFHSRQDIYRPVLHPSFGQEKKLASLANTLSQKAT